MHIAGFRIRIRIRRIRIFSDPGKKVRKWMNKSLFCRVGDVQWKQFHFFCSDFKHPLLRIIWIVKKNSKKIIFFLYPQLSPPDPHENFCPDPDPNPQKKNADPKPWRKDNLTFTHNCLLFPIRSKGVINIIYIITWAHKTSLVIFQSHGERASRVSRVGRFKVHWASKL